MPQDDEKQPKKQPRDDHADQQASSQQPDKGPASPEVPDPEFDGRVPDDEPIPGDRREDEFASSEAASEEVSTEGASSDTVPAADHRQPTLFDEDGTPQFEDQSVAPHARGLDEPHPDDLESDAVEPVDPYAANFPEDTPAAGSSGPMVEPGDSLPDDEGVEPVNPYEVEPPQPEEQPYSYDYYEDTYTDPAPAIAPPADDGQAKPGETKALAAAGGGGGKPPALTSVDDEDEDEDEEGMLRMSFMEHLEELRTRLIRIVVGLLLAFVISIVFSPDLWKIVQQPAESALTSLGIDPPNLTQIQPMEAFNVVYLKLPLLSAIFLSSPWILWQIWGFIAPGLYRRERRWAAPFVIVSAGLFITGGLFAYFIAFRFGLTFLLGIGRDINITPMVSITEYFNLFVNVVLAIAIVFELPVLIFFLTLLRIVSPSFLVRNSRYAILGIVILAAIITPTPDVFNLMIFSVPMIVLFFVGVLFSYILVLHQEGKRFPWKVFYWTVAGLLLMVAGEFLLSLCFTMNINGNGAGHF
jgi:sec-independent protein translocase protein TatC